MAAPPHRIPGLRPSFAIEYLACGAGFIRTPLQIDVPRCYELRRQSVKFSHEAKATHAT